MMEAFFVIIGILIVTLLGFAVEFLSEIIFQLKSLRSQVEYFSTWCIASKDIHCRAVHVEERAKEAAKKVENATE